MLSSLFRFVVLAILAVVVIVALAVAWWIAVLAVLALGVWFAVRRMLGAPGPFAGVAGEPVDGRPVAHNPLVIEGEYREVEKDKLPGDRDREVN